MAKELTFPKPDYYLNLQKRGVSSYDLYLVSALPGLYLADQHPQPVVADGVRAAINI